MLIRRKAYAYITHGSRLLVFVHVNKPEAGIQVPGGSLEDGEDPAVGALREAYEETGLENLTLVRFLGEQWRDLRPHGMEQTDHRHFYHLRCEGDVPERWRHSELTPSDGGVGPIPFELYWVNLFDVLPQLIAEQGFLLDRLIETIQQG